MATSPNLNQIAEGAEQGMAPVRAPYRGADPQLNHVGRETLNAAFEAGAVYGYYRQFYDPHF